MPYSSVEFEVSEDPEGRLRVSGGDVVSALVNALAQGELDVACRLYEESGRAVAERLLAAVQAEAALRIYRAFAKGLGDRVRALSTA